MPQVALVFLAWVGKASSPKGKPQPRGRMSSLVDIIPPFSRFGSKGWGREGKEGCGCIQQCGRALSNAETDLNCSQGRVTSSFCPTWGKTRQELCFYSVSLLKSHSYLPLCYQVSAVVQEQSSSSHSSPWSCQTQCSSSPSSQGRHGGNWKMGLITTCN